MNFIFTILAFLTLSLTSFGVSTQISHFEWNMVFTVFGVITGLATLVTTLAMMFQNMLFNTQINSKINEIRQNVRRISQKTFDLSRYKEEFKSTLTEMYPQYEKDIFNAMSKNDATQLEMILVKYPELKFDGVLNTYIDGVKSRLNDINSYESYISSTLMEIANINTNGWILKEFKLPSDIQELNDK